MTYLCSIPSELGKIVAASDGENLTGLWFENQKYFASTLSETTMEKSLPVFDLTREWLELYFNKQEPNISIPLAAKGTPFRQAVWQILLDIPYGTLTTYGDIAKQMAKQMNKETMSSQAIGGAVGHNPISIIIPCHRVIGSNKSLTGYAGGIDKKMFLLELENVPVHDLHMPKRAVRYKL